MRTCPNLLSVHLLTMKNMVFTFNRIHRLIWWQWKRAIHHIKFEFNEFWWIIGGLLYTFIVGWFLTNRSLCIGKRSPHFFGATYIANVNMKNYESLFSRGFMAEWSKALAKNEIGTLGGGSNPTWDFLQFFFQKCL